MDARPRYDKGMRWVPLVVVVCGCNNVFDLRATRLADAPPTPPPIDAPPDPVCPALGTVPTFGDELQQVDAKQCEGYVVGKNDVAMASCGGQFARGYVDGQLQPITVDPEAFDVPRLAPDGERVFLAAYNSQSARYELREYAWQDPAFMMMSKYIPPTDYAGEAFTFSTPSDGPDRHVVYSDHNYTSGADELVEISDSSGTWTELKRYAMKDDMGNPLTVAQPSLSADGLRLVFVTYTLTYTGGGGIYTINGGAGATSGTTSGTTSNFIDPYGGGCISGTEAVFYADRMAKTDAFGVAHLIDSLPNQLSYPYMTANCGKIYFSALNRVYYYKLKQP